MSRANLLAVGFVLAGLGCILLGLLASSAPLIEGPDAVLRSIEPTYPPGEGPSPLLAAWVRQAPHLFWLAGVAVCTLPGIFLFLVAALIRFQVAKPRELEDLRQAAAGPAREAHLQWLLRECVEGSVEAAPARAARMYRAATRSFAELDPDRRARFHLFLREARLEPVGFELPAPVAAPAPPDFARRRLWARLVTLALSIAALLAGLWGLLCFAFLDHMAQAMQLYLGPHEGALMLAFVWLVAGLLVLGALGVAGLSRLDRKAAGCWAAGFAASCDRLLAATRDCLERAAALHGNDSACAAHLARGLILSGLRGLDASRKRAFLVAAREAGALRAHLDLGAADLRDSDLSGLDLSGLGLRKAYLSGASLAGANLAVADLQEADLRAADLRGANLRSAVLRQARMEGCRLHQAFLAGADLSGAHLEGASIWQADLARADLSRAEVTSAQLELARSLTGALLPDGLGPGPPFARSGA